MASVASGTFIPCEKVFSVATDALRDLTSEDGISNELNARIESLYKKIVGQRISIGIKKEGSGRERQAERAIIFLKALDAVPATQITGTLRATCR